MIDLIRKLRDRLFPRPLDQYSRADEYRKLGVKIGAGTCIYGFINFGSEPYLIEIGDNCLFSGATSFITHDGAIAIGLDQLPEDVSKFGRIRIGRRCFVGPHTIFMPGVSVGDGSVVGPGSVVTHNIPSGEIWAGNPARFVKTVDAYLRQVEESSKTPEQQELREVVRQHRGYV